MVRIVNGVIVNDDAPQSAQRSAYQPAPSPSTSNFYRPFPNTGGIFGSASQTVTFLKLEIEIFWIIVIFISGFLFGGKSLAIIVFCLIVLERNIKIAKSKEPRFARVNRQ
ncbi:hypothetical protein SteCoe_33001 [Stentor coeruleus]|uniref:Uncharacterized protein n=1 Tax=Stentor coeruleus TaxID=5963 RepID=A0A1R2AXN2_9CILI|nr:hypothetical protein SteCoe_33001 [Stentor coeruleus]